MEPYTILVNILAAMTVIRLFFMPIVALINKAIEASESLDDDVKWGAIKNSWWFIMIQVTLDYAVGLQLEKPEEDKK